ncbi:hypothetical protein [Enterococcus faecalis]|uniref:hypothetical protein n=1 Tax=Enterococcus faecalis TaxID=1351 RepID=UPI0040427FF9
MFKCVAVVNDSTGEFAYILSDYISRFPSKVPVYATNIEQLKQYGKFGENELYKVETCDGFNHIVISEKYSFIFDEQEEAE